jgi:hypothetical protein
MGDRRIYTDEDAARFFKPSAGKSYRPSNGTEGEMFQEAWCAQCEADRAFRDDPERADGCPIIANVMALAIDDPDYPPAWVYGPDGQPICSAFVEIGTATTPRCDATIDMFAARRNIDAEG